MLEKKHCYRSGKVGLTKRKKISSETKMEIIRQRISGESIASIVRNSSSKKFPIAYKIQNLLNVLFRKTDGDVEKME